MQTIIKFAKLIEAFGDCKESLNGCVKALACRASARLQEESFREKWFRQIVKELPLSQAAV